MIFSGRISNETYNVASRTCLKSLTMVNELLISYPDSLVLRNKAQKQLKWRCGAGIFHLYSGHLDVACGNQFSSKQLEVKARNQSTVSKSPRSSEEGISNKRFP